MSGAASTSMQQVQLTSAELCSCPDEAETNAYYDGVLRHGGQGLSATIEVRVECQEDHREAVRWPLYKSVHAKRPIKEGDIVFIEDPLICMQHVENSESIRCCSGCLRFVDGDGPVCCRSGRVETQFCEDCRMSTAASVHRRYMCTSSNDRDSDKALGEFYGLAAETNDIFILAAKVLLSVMHGAKGTKDLREVWRPYAMGYKMLWWKSVARPEDVPEDEEAAFRADLKELASDAFDAFCDMVQEANPRDFDRYRGNLLSLDVWGSIIGMFELNNLNILARGPEHGVLQDGDDLDSNDGSAVCDELVEGSGFYVLHSCFNHSCDPNCRVLVPRDDSENGKAIVQTVRDIAEGEELTVSYIEETEPYLVRQEHLRDYGFECRCSRCLLEFEFCV
jgi:hypothetical protein